MSVLSLDPGVAQATAPSTRCPMCDATTARRHDRSPLYRCPDCSTIFRARADRSEEIAHWDDYLGNDLEQSFDKLRAHFYREYWSIIRRLPDRPAGATSRPRLLDVGCVPGTLMQLAIDDGWDAHGVELSETLCEMIRRRVGVSPRRGRFEELDFGRERFDLIVASDVLRHTDEPIRFLRRAFDVMNPGGALVIRDVDPRHPRLAGRLAQPYAFDMQMLAPETIGRCLQRIGFGEVGVRSSPMSLLTLRSVRRLAERAPIAYIVLVRSVNTALSLLHRVRPSRGAFLSPSYLVWARRTDPSP